MGMTVYGLHLDSSFLNCILDLHCQVAENIILKVGKLVVHTVAITEFFLKPIGEVKYYQLHIATTNVQI
jgi:hypothetical protein